MSHNYVSWQVLQRKTEEASLATKRLKELLESKKTSSRETGSSGPGIQVSITKKDQVHFLAINRNNNHNGYLIVYSSLMLITL